MDKVYKTFITQSKAIDAEKGIYEVMISTEAIDRQGDIVRALGGMFDNFNKNPVVMYAHNYASLPVAKSLEIKPIRGRGVRSVFQFPTWGMSQQADEVHHLWDEGFLNAASIGFQPLEWNPIDENGKQIEDASEYYWGPKEYTSWELLEYSIVPVPANQDALRLGVKALGDSRPILLSSKSVLPTIETKRGRVLSAANEKLIREAVKGLTTVLDSLGQEPEQESLKMAVPYGDHGMADESMAWSGPTLGDFTADTWGDLSDAEKNRIAAHFAKTDEMPPTTYGALGYPHHVAGKSGVGEAVWRGVAAAMQRCMQQNEDQAVIDHLAKHYKQFDKPVPESLADDDAVLKAQPGEHIYVVRNADEFEPGTFRRMVREVGDKTHDVIMGQPLGENAMADQSYRYPVTTWTLDEVVRHTADKRGIELIPATSEAALADWIIEVIRPLKEWIK